MFCKNTKIFYLNILQTTWSKLCSISWQIISVSAIPLQYSVQSRTILVLLFFALKNNFVLFLFFVLLLTQNLGIFPINLTRVLPDFADKIYFKDCLNRREDQSTNFSTWWNFVFFLVIVPTPPSYFNLWKHVCKGSLSSLFSSESPPANMVLDKLLPFITLHSVLFFITSYSVPPFKPNLLQESYISSECMFNLSTIYNIFLYSLHCCFKTI